MRPLIFTILLLLLLAGNCFAAYKMFTDKDFFLAKMPGLTEKQFTFFRWLPLLNIVLLAGIWFWQYWAVWLIVIAGVVVIAFDIYYSFFYHLYLAIPSFLLLLFFIIKYWVKFK